MASVLTFNDFRYGMVSEYMRRRTDIALYQKSASLIENAVPIRTGGVRLRPGMVRDLDLSGIKAERIIPFVISVREHYLLVLCAGKLYIYGLSLSGAYENISGEGFNTGYTSSEIQEVQVAHNNERAILVQRNHPPIVVEKGSTGGWNAGTIVLDTSTSAYNYTYDEDGNESKSSVEYDYEGLFTRNNFPSVAAFHGSRLWLGAPTEHPFRMWASKPFEYRNFQTEDYYNYLDESVSVEQYLDAIQGSSETSELLEDGAYCWRVSKTVNASAGTVSMVSAVYMWDAEEQDIGELVGHREYDPETDTWGDIVLDNSSWTYTYMYTKPVYKLDTVVREDSAMMLDMASDRDETISWLASNGELIFVGTASSEWAMPSSINALTQTITKIASYGSAPFLQSCYGVKNIFYVQSGGQLLRSIYTDEESSSAAFQELTFQCSDILSAGVREMAWQRVPEPRLYCILKDGTMAVLCYDKDYDVNAWCVWKTEGYSYKSIAIIDNEQGQEVFILATRASDGAIVLVHLEDGVYKDDGSVDVIARIATNNLDTAQTMLFTKKSFRVAADSMHTRFKARMNSRSQAVSSDYSRDLVVLWNWTQPTNNGLRAEFESYPGEDMTLLAVMVETEVGA